MDVYITIFLYCLVTSITPGPNNIMLMTSGLNHGIKKTMPHLLGINIGFPLMIVAVGFGLGTILLNFPVVHKTIKFLGISYLLYLAWKIANAGNPCADRTLQKPLSFIQAAAFQWVNPKAWVMAIGAIAAFTTPDNFQLQMAIIVLGFLTVGALSMLCWLAMGAGLQKLIANEKHVRVFNVIMGALLAASAIPMLFTELNKAP